MDKQLGKGAFGIVRIAIEKSTGARYAVKSISKAKLSCKEDVKDVQNEVAILNHVGGHVNVVSVKVRRTRAAPGMHMHTRVPAQLLSIVFCPCCRARTRTLKMCT